MSSVANLDMIGRDAAKVAEEVGIDYLDGDFWLALPNEAIREQAGECALAAMKQPIKRRAVLLVRHLFLSDGVCTLKVGDRRVAIEFQPAIIAGKTREGRGYSKVDDLLCLLGGQDDSEAQPCDIPDTGPLLASLEESTRSLQAIDDLLVDPSAIASSDKVTRDITKELICAAKDKALIGLGSLGAILSEGDGGDREAWLARVAEASSAMVEDMADLGELPEEKRAGKLKSLEALKRTIARYFAHIDPNSEALKKFSAGISQLVLEERREIVESNKKRIEKDIDISYTAIICAIQEASPNGSSMTILPLPQIQSMSGSWCKIVLNMHHLVMAVQHSGFHMRAIVDPYRSKRLWEELKAWDEKCPVRLHIVSREYLDRRNQHRARSMASYRTIDPVGDTDSAFADFLSR